MYEQQLENFDNLKDYYLSSATEPSSEPPTPRWFEHEDWTRAREAFPARTYVSDNDGVSNTSVDVTEVTEDIAIDVEDDNTVVTSKTIQSMPTPVVEEKTWQNVWMCSIDSKLNCFQEIASPPATGRSDLSIFSSFLSGTLSSPFDGDCSVSERRKNPPRVTTREEKILKTSQKAQKMQRTKVSNDSDGLELSTTTTSTSTILQPRIDAAPKPWNGRAPGTRVSFIGEAALDELLK